MDEQMVTLEREEAAPPAQPQQQGSRIKREQLTEWTKVLNRYRSGKSRLEGRVKSAENWWRLRNAEEEQKELGRGPRGFESRSAWLHNVIVSKHADALKAYPEPSILPREEGDRGEAKMLSSIIPCVLEQNDFEEVYSQVVWAKLKTGTGVYKVVWDPRKYNSLGDVAIYSCDILNLFWEPGVKDIQKSRYFFQTERRDRDLLEEQYPELKTKLKGGDVFRPSKFDTEDTPENENKVTVIEVYYHKMTEQEDGSRKALLHYCQYVGDQVLYASEDDPNCQENGFYAHGEFPFVFDVLFPIEGSPCGYGFVDLCKNPQTAIDLMRNAMVRNMVNGATPRYFVRQDGAFSAEDFADVTREIIPVKGPVTEEYIRTVDFKPLSGNYINALNEVIQELRETSGNTETATGSVNYGVTAASAIAALQEASGKGSADSTQRSYRACRKVDLLVLELIRQFYTTQRQFRITGENGEMQFVSYDNTGIMPQYQGTDFGEDMGYRIPLFDIKISQQKQNAYSRLSQNELALQLYNAGMFAPQMGDTAMPALEMMEFEGKESVIQKVARNAQLLQQFQAAAQAAMALAQRYEPQNLPMLAQQLGMGGAAPGMAGAPGGGSLSEETNSAAITASQGDDTRTRNARERAASAGQPQ